MALEDNGNLQPTAHIVDTALSRFAQISSMETFIYQGQAFVATAGSDDGFSLTRLLPGGRLLHQETRSDTTETALQKVTALTVLSGAEHVDIFTS